MNSSKVKEKRFWVRWKKAGAIGRIESKKKIAKILSNRKLELKDVWRMNEEKLKVGRIDLAVKAFKNHNPSSFEKFVIIRGRKEYFAIKFGRFLFYTGNSHVLCKNDFLIEINEMEKSAEILRRDLPLEGFDSQLCLDYVNAAIKIVLDFCKEKKLEIIDFFESWPTFQVRVRAVK